MCNTMNPDKIINHLQIKRVLTKKDADELARIFNKRERTRKLLTILKKSNTPSIHHLKIALIKSGHSELLQHLVEKEEKDSIKARDRCFIHLQDNCYVVAKELKDIFISTSDITTRKSLKRFQRNEA